MDGQLIMSRLNTTGLAGRCHDAKAAAYAALSPFYRQTTTAAILATEVRHFALISRHF